MEPEETEQLLGPSCHSPPGTTSPPPPPPFFYCSNNTSAPAVITPPTDAPTHSHNKDVQVNIFTAQVFQSGQTSYSIHTYQFQLKIIFTIVTQMTGFQLEMLFFIIFAHMSALTYFVSYVLLNIHMHPLSASTELQVL